MPPALFPAEQQSRTWWSLSRSPSSKDLRQVYTQEKQPMPQGKPSGKLNSFASAIGFKSKKQSSSLAIQEPPIPVINAIPRSNTAPNIAPPAPMNRPPSKSVSSTRSRVDSVEPRTPVDFQRENRHSLLTLSDADPFAGRPMIAPPVPHLLSDPNRLSAYSNSSVTDIVQKKIDSAPTFNRVSYASSSSNSNNHGIESPTFPSANSPNGASEYRQLINKRSVPNLQATRSEVMHQQASVTPASSSGSKSGSSSMLLGPQRRSQIDSVAPLRPRMRARGMTDTGASQRAGFFVEDPSAPRIISHKSSSSNFKPPSPDFSASQEASSSTSPRVVIRQASIPRLQSPPSAPPTHRLPPPPLSLHIDDPQQPTAGTSASSSSISFASSDSFMGPPHILSNYDSPLSHQRSLFPHNTLESDLDSLISFAQPKDVPSPPRTLKKALSHNSLTRRIHTSPTPTPKSPVDPATEKSSRKLRAFGHPRLPIPPIPLSIRPSSSSGPAPFPTTSDGGAALGSEKRASRSSTSRKRLFSNSSRPSTSHHSPTTREDDTQSVFSLRSDVDAHLSHFKPWLTTPKTSSTSSFWDEGGSDQAPSSPTRANPEYTPQAIISRADVEKLEASVDSYSPERVGARTRGFSILSSSTVLSDVSKDADCTPTGLSPPPPTKPSSKQVSMRISSSAKPPIFQTPSRSPPSSITPNDDDHPHDLLMHSLALPLSQIAMRPSTSPVSGMISLPPPPRRPRKTTLVSQPAIPEMTVAAPTMTILPPRTPSVHKASSIRSNSKSTVEKSLHRRSIMRKPSFLDIDDDTDHEADFDDRITGSFLDLARESFDTVRSDG